MIQEMDNEKIHGGENINYIPFSISWPIRTEQKKETYQRKCLQSPLYKTKHTNP